MSYLALAPLLIVAVGALLGVLVEALVPRRGRFVTQVWLSAIVLLVALGFTARNYWFDPASRHLAGLKSVAVDVPTLMCWAGLLVFALGAVVLTAQRFDGVSSFTPMAVAAPGSVDEQAAETAGGEHTEVFPLMLFAVTGMLLFPAANDLLAAFIGLEVLSLPLYLLTGLARRRRLISHEASLKYFLLGAFSSAIFLYGAALTYGYAGGIDYATIDASLVSLANQPLLLAGFGLLMIGLLFKVGAVPFHAWVPDTYTGAPTPVAAFMAVGTKVASFGALVRLLYVAFGGLAWTWTVPVAIVSALTMVVGTVFGLTQSNIKRLLAYSSVAHVGFVLAPIAVALGVVGTGAISSMTALVYYLSAYGVATLGAFGVVLLVRDGAGETPELTAWSGLGRRHPWLAASMTLFLFSLAGIPVTAGFIGKVDAFVVAWRGGLWWLVIVGLAFSLVAMVFYMRVVLVMWFGKPSPDELAPDELTPDDAEAIEQSAAEPAPELRVPVSMAILLGLCVVATLAAGVVPDLFTRIAGLAGQLLR